MAKKNITKAPPTRSQLTEEYLKQFRKTFSMTRREAVNWNYNYFFNRWWNDRG